MKTSLKLDHGMQLWKNWPSPKLQKLQTNYEDFLNLTSKYIFQALDKNESFIQKLSQRGCTQKEIITVTGDMMFGGIETVVSLLSFSLYQLAKNPQVQEKLHQEIIQIKDLTQIDKLPYLNAVIKETLRLNPPAALVTRKVSNEFIMGNYEFPPNVNFVLCHYHMGTSEKYVKNPDDFSPERWIRNSGNHEKFHPYLVKPFGHGHRVCIGKSIALMEVGIFLVKTLNEYRVEWHYDDIQMKSQLVMVPSLPLKFKFVER